MILVTGATGILGRVIVLELLKQGFTVRATKRPNSNLKEVEQSFAYYTENAKDFFKKIEWVNVDFNDIDTLQSALKNVTEVYHCAGKVSFHPKDKKEMYQTNITGTQNLLYACEGSSVQKFCFVSSIAVLDGLNEFGEMDENSDYNAKLNHSDYAISKHFSEMEVWRASAEGLNTVIINPGVIIGSGNWQHSSGKLFQTSEKNRYTLSGGTAYVDVRDVAKIAITLMEKNIFSERFVLVSENMKFADFSKEIRNILNLPEPKILPNSFLNLIILIAELFGWLVPSFKIINKNNIKSVTTFNKISNKKIKEKLGFNFIPISESIRFHLNHYKGKK
ncbi:MAG: NAD-dependent epimerase/dehydratase family protein [Cruoricaptor ignavus]|nr:NAD-dependent epimerase/dehydratase family protein [Cruoricaptor ignavus]